MEKRKGIYFGWGEVRVAGGKGGRDEFDRELSMEILIVSLIGLPMEENQKHVHTECFKNVVLFM